MGFKTDDAMNLSQGIRNMFTLRHGLLTTEVF